MKVKVIKISVLSRPGPAAKIGRASTPEPIAAPATIKDDRSNFLKLSTIVTFIKNSDFTAINYTALALKFIGAAQHIYVDLIGDAIS
jgi:hypothetical protein